MAFPYLQPNYNKVFLSTRAVQLSPLRTPAQNAPQLLVSASTGLQRGCCQHASLTSSGRPNPSQIFTQPQKTCAIEASPFASQRELRYQTHYSDCIKSNHPTSSSADNTLGCCTPWLEWLHPRAEALTSTDLARTTHTLQTLVLNENQTNPIF